MGLTVHLTPYIKNNKLYLIGIKFKLTFWTLLFHDVTKIICIKLNLKLHD